MYKKKIAWLSIRITLRNPTDLMTTRNQSKHNLLMNDISYTFFFKIDPFCILELISSALECWLGKNCISITVWVIMRILNIHRISDDFCCKKAYKYGIIEKKIFSEKSVYKKKWSWCCFKFFWQKVSRFIHQPTPSFSAPLAPLPAMCKDDSPSSSSSSTLCYISQFLLIYFSKQSLFKLHQDVRAALQICSVLLHTPKTHMS